jgi:hypothetical protein
LEIIQDQESLFVGKVVEQLLLSRFWAAERQIEGLRDGRYEGVERCDRR